MADLIPILEKISFAGVLVLVLLWQNRDRKADRAERATEQAGRDAQRAAELVAREKHWSEEVVVLAAMRDSLTRIETRQIGAEMDASWMRGEIGVAARRLEAIRDFLGIEPTQVRTIPPSPPRGTPRGG